MSPVTCGLRCMRKSSFAQSLQYLIGAGQVHMARCNVIATSYHFMAAYLDESDCFLVAGFEPNRCASGNIQAIPIGFEPIEVELRIRLDEVIM